MDPIGHKITSEDFVNLQKYKHRQSSGNQNLIQQDDATLKLLFNSGNTIASQIYKDNAKISSRSSNLLNLASPFAPRPLLTSGQLQTDPGLGMPAPGSASPPPDKDKSLNKNQQQMNQKLAYMRALLQKNQEKGVQDYLKDVIVEDAINFQDGVISKNLDFNDIENLNRINQTLYRGIAKGMARVHSLGKGA